MKKLLIVLSVMACVAGAVAVLGGSVFAGSPPKLDPMPEALSNNAVATIKAGKVRLVYSFLGIGEKKTWNAISNRAFELNLSTGKWVELRSVPGVAGRLAASAIAVKDQVYLVGGYVVDGQGVEATLPDLNSYVPEVHRWYRGADVPVPVDDAVIGAYRDRYIYLISGWSKTDAVKNVQVYDTEKDRWTQATPIPGTPVFGHAGGILGDTIVVVDGAYKNPAGTNPKYVASEECWMGKIDHKNPGKIRWSKLPAHPGAARYRIAAGSDDKGKRIYFTGGTDNPYNFDGVGYNGRASEPSAMTFAFNVRSEKWETLNAETPEPTMDHRGLVVTPEGLLVVGGMAKGQQVTGKVSVVEDRAKDQ